MVIEMRLALIATLLPADTRGGAEAYVEAVARSLAERHDVVVLTGSKAPEVDGIPTVRLPRLPILQHAAPWPGRVLWHALDQWLPHVHTAVARELRRIEPDLVVTHNPQGLSAAVFTAVAEVGVPHVHTAHDLNLLCARTTMTRGGEFCGGRCAGCVVQRRIRGAALRRNLAILIGVSRYVCERHVREGIVPREKAKAIRLGAAPGRTRLRRLGGDDLRLGFIGALAPHKGILTLVEALRRTSEPWRLSVAGSGHLDSQIAAAARQDPRIEFLGHVSGDRKDAFFDGLDLVVIPSEWEEPATFVAMEGAVRGIPAVVSHRGGLPETPEARTFRAGDADELVRAIRWFVEQPERLEDASTRLLANRKDYEWATHVAGVERILHEVVAHARATRRLGGAQERAVRLRG
jgi:glycosyltransferase involved in cell wall biosynthesis